MSAWEHIGSSTFEYSIFGFDIYDIDYFRSSEGFEELVLSYKRDVKRKYSLKGWEKGLMPYLQQEPELREKAMWIYQHTIDLEKGDIFKIRKEEKKVAFKKNEVLIASIEDEGVSKLVFAPWIGEKPISKKIKEELLKKIK